MYSFACRSVYTQNSLQVHIGVEEHMCTLILQKPPRLADAQDFYAPQQVADSQTVGDESLALASLLC